MKLDVIGLGECSIDEVWMVPAMPAAGAKLRALGHTRLGGGQVATAMCAVARLGKRAAFIGAVGADSEGDAVIAGLGAEDVDASAVTRVGGGQTRSALLLVDPSGERTVIERVDRHVHVAPLAVPVASIASARILHLDATMLPAAILAAKAAMQSGIVVSIDLDHVRPGVDELLALCDICITSSEVPQKLTGREDLQSALRDLRGRLRHGALVGCTLGDRGAAALDGDQLIVLPAFSPPQLMDTTACGDTFHAAALCALLDGASIPQMLRFANAAAALKCRDLGRRGCPTRDEVGQFLRS